MCPAYNTLPGEAGAIPPKFDPASLCDDAGRLLCVPEQILGVSMHEDGPVLDRLVRHAVRQLQRRHHPDRPSGSLFLSRYESTH